MNRIPSPPAVCPACGETTGTDLTVGSYHRTCVERLLARQRRDRERGASLLEYLMLLAFVAVIGIVGLRAVGPAAAGMFDTGRLGLTDAVPTEVLGATVERPTTTTTFTTVVPIPECHGMGRARCAI